jgi:hypothetical protein
MYEKATARSSWFRSAEGMGELREGRKTSGVADEIAVVRATELMAKATLWRRLLYGSSGLICDLNWFGVRARTIQREPGVK